MAKGMLMDRFDIDAVRAATGTAGSGPPAAQRRRTQLPRVFDPTVGRYELDPRSD